MAIKNIFNFGSIGSDNIKKVLKKIKNFEKSKYLSFDKKYLLPTILYQIILKKAEGN